MRLSVFLCASFLLNACAPMAEHGPISAKTMAQMEERVLTKAEFLQRLAKSKQLPQQSVMLPMHLVSGVPVIKATINNRGSIPMMLDTGASRSMIQAPTAVAKRVSVLRAEDATVELQGVVGREKSRIGLLDPLVLGNWSLSGYPCLIRIHENRVAGMSGARSFPENLLGFDVALDRCSFLTLDYPQESATFGFHQKFEPADPSRSSDMPFKVAHRVPFITLRSGDVSWEAIVDTGSFNGVEINEAVATRLGVQNEGEAVHGLYLMGVGGTVSSVEAKMRKVMLPKLTLVGGTYPKAEMDISPGPPRVGSFFLKDYRVTFDFRRKKLWLEW